MKLGNNPPLVEAFSSNLFCPAVSCYPDQPKKLVLQHPLENA
jgi:hypothetical protein